MQKCKLYIFFVFCLLLQLHTKGQVRSIIDFNKDWRFYLGDDSSAKFVNYDDSKWRKLSVPHDWSIESDFIKDAPATNQGGSLPGGIGWYRKEFVLPVAEDDKVVTIEFDGVYQNSEVWINGNYLGRRPNGYINFSYQITHYLKPSPQKNIISVKVDNSQQPNSRWYSGSGIYRNVKLVITNLLHFEKQTVFISASSKDEKVATVKVNASFFKWDIRKKLKVNLAIIEGDKIVQQSHPQVIYDEKFMGKIKEDFIIESFRKWDTDNPYLYKLKISLLTSNNFIIDEVTIPFGIRSFHFDKDKGFFLNYKPLKLQGVCMHHDLGALGAAFNKTAAKRQLTILKEMGCNAIRFSHNPPASAMLDLCDEMGFLVIDEAFDMWKKKKNKYDYHKDFTEWHKRDLEAMIYRDRNHPSVIALSIGNEIREQFDSTGITLTKELVAIVKAIDPTRPVISALTETMPEKNFIAKAGVLDILGFNYKDYDYKSLPSRFPGMPLIATETASAIETRGVYEFPSDSIRTWPPDYKAQDTFAAGNKDYTGPAYDNTKAYWGNTHEKSWLAVKNNQHIAGAFVWSGFDYLGEPLPYPKFPARSSYFGIIDLAGFPKDVYYMYQSEWNKKNVLHIFPHWSWSKGDTVDVWAYYNNADEVELFVNNKSVGIRSKADSTLHIMWRVPFQPGVLKAVSRKNGKIILSKEIKTAGKPARIELIADQKFIKADGTDLCFVTARIVDAAGNVVPDADNLIEFSITGDGTIAGTDNGYQADTISLKGTKRKAWKGHALAILQSTLKKGNITLLAKAVGIKPAIIVIKTGY
jgi:beta-galactosidase